MKNISTLLWLGIATYMPSSFAFAQNAAQQKITEEIIEAVAKPDKEEDKLVSKYDYVKDITRVKGRRVYWRDKSTSALTV